MIKLILQINLFLCSMMFKWLVLNQNSNLKTISLGIDGSSFGLPEKNKRPEDNTQTKDNKTEH